MRALFRENIGEAIVGLLVVILAVWFVIFAWNRTGGGQKAGSIHVTAIFPNASGVTPGTDVRVVTIAPLGDPLRIEVRGGQWSIRKQEAAQILVEP